MSQPARPTNPMAVLSLVGGIASYLGFLCIGALVGIVCGHIARAQIRQSGEDGDRYAVWGLWLGYTHLVLSGAALLIWLLFLGGLVALGLAAGH